MKTLHEMALTTSKMLKEAKAQVVLHRVSGHPIGKIHPIGLGVFEAEHDETNDTHRSDSKAELVDWLHDRHAAQDGERDEDDQE